MIILISCCFRRAFAKVRLEAIFRNLLDIFNRGQNVPSFALLHVNQSLVSGIAVLRNALID